MVGVWLSETPSFGCFPRTIIDDDSPSSPALPTKETVERLSLILLVDFGRSGFYALERHGKCQSSAFLRILDEFILFAVG